MYTPQITAQMATAHRHDMIAAAAARRLARQVARDEHRPSVKRRLRPWVLWTTRPAHG